MYISYYLSRALYLTLSYPALLSQHDSPCAPLSITLVLVLARCKFTLYPCKTLSLYLPHLGFTDKLANVNMHTHAHA